MLVNIPVNQLDGHSVRAGNCLRMRLIWNPMDLKHNQSMYRSDFVDSFQWFSMDLVRPFYTNTKVGNSNRFDTWVTLLACVSILMRHHTQTRIGDDIFEKHCSNVAQSDSSSSIAFWQMPKVNLCFVWSFNILLNHYSIRTRRHRFFGKFIQSKDLQFVLRREIWDQKIEQKW